MENEKRNGFISFLIGLFLGWIGIPIMFHIFYITVIVALISAYVLKK